MRQFKSTSLFLFLLVLASFAAVQSNADEPGFESIGEVTGKIYFGPETMYFHTCDDWENAFWLDEGTSSADGWTDVAQILNQQPVCSLATIPCTYQQAFVSGTAEISDKGSYGHLNAWERTIRFKSITSVDEPGNCKPPKP